MFHATRAIIRQLNWWGSGSRNTKNTGKYRSSIVLNTENVQYRNFNTSESQKCSMPLPISNLKGTDERLWVHVVLVILFLPMGIAIMRHFSVNLGLRSEEEDATSRTLMISGVPDTYCTKEFIHRHVIEAYNDDSIVEEVQIAYDVSKKQGNQIS